MALGLNRVFGVFFLGIIAIVAVAFTGCAKKSVTTGGEGQAIATEEVSGAQGGAGEGETSKVRGLEESALEGGASGAHGMGEGEISEGRTSAPLLPIYFDFDKYNIRGDMVGRMEQNARYLLENPQVRIQIQGNCDERGTNEYNMALGEKRAKSAKDFLVNMGVDPKRIDTVSFGEERPLDPGHNEEAWAKNRRDDFVIIP